MEYAWGGDLQRRLIFGRPYPLGESLRIFGQLCNAVQYAHEHGIIHRDLKPLNILFRQLPNGTEQVVLSDFGLSINVDATHHTFSQAGTLESIVAVLLSQDAETSFGAHYSLVGNIVAVVTQAAVIDANRGTTTLLVKAQGVWVYHFSSASKLWCKVFQERVSRCRL